MDHNVNHPWLLTDAYAFFNLGFFILSLIAVVVFFGTWWRNRRNTDRAGGFLVLFYITIGALMAAGILRSTINLGGTFYVWYTILTRPFVLACIWYPIYLIFRERVKRYHYDRGNKKE